MNRRIITTTLLGIVQWPSAAQANRTATPGRNG